MADIVGSRRMKQNQLRTDFQQAVRFANAKDNLLSPLTITLGDEFQGVAPNLITAIAVIFRLEEYIIAESKKFKLRYVLVEGDIDTPINREIAYGMMGAGLTQARETLNLLKETKERFHIHLLDDDKSKTITSAFVVFQRLVDDWNPDRDYYLVSEFLQLKDYKRVAADLDKERSLIWKRERSLKMKEYFAMKDVIIYLGG